MDQTTVLYMFIGVLLLLFAFQMIVNIRQQQATNQQQLNLAAIFEKTIKDMVNNPVYLENAKAVGRSIPQESFNLVYTRLDALEEFVGNESVIGKALQAGEDLLKRIDRDPANDPAAQADADATA